MDDPPLDFIKIGRFPAHTYAKIDILQGRRRLAGGSAQPKGITSCLDETVCLDETALLAVDAPNDHLVRYRLSHPMIP